MFLIKDLLVSVLRSDEDGVGRVEPEHTSCILSFGTGEVPTSMTLLLAALKGQLENALNEIDREEKATGEQLLPNTLAQIEMLQTNFDQAQIELNRLRTEILKKK